MILEKIGNFLRAVLEKMLKKILNPYNPGYISSKTKRSSSVLYYHTKNWEIAGAVLEKTKNTFWGYIMPYNPGSRMFTLTPYDSNDWPICPLHLSKKIRKILKTVLKKRLNK